MPGNDAPIRADAEASAAVRCLGFSRMMALAGLSSRSPWNTECRIRLSLVHSAKETSASSFGCTQWAFFAIARGLTKGLLSVTRAPNFSRKSASVRSLKPVPDIARILERSILRMHAQQQRADPRARSLRVCEAANHELLPMAAFEFDPVGIAPGCIGCGLALADHALEAQLASRGHQIGRLRLERFAEAYAVRGRLFHHRPQQLPPLHDGQLPQVASSA